MADSYAGKIFERRCAMEGRVHVGGVIKGTVFAMAITFLFILVLSLISYFGQMNDTIVTVALFVGVIAGVFLGAMPVARGAEKGALWHGLAVGGIYLVVLVLVSLVMNQRLEWNTHFLTLAAGSLGAGLLGGILGAK